MLVHNTSYNKEHTTMDAPQAPTPTPQELKAALKAFKKRLKLTCLDDQSRIGVGPMSSGRASGICAITPPDQYPEAVWIDVTELSNPLTIADTIRQNLTQPETQSQE